VAFAKVYHRRTPIRAADLPNDRILPFFESHEIRALGVFTHLWDGVLWESDTHVT